MKKLLLVLLFAAPLLLQGQTKYFSLYTTYEHEGDIKQWHNEYKKFLPGIGSELNLKNGLKFSLGVSHNYSELKSTYFPNNNTNTYTTSTYSSHDIQIPISIGYSIFRKRIFPYQVFITGGYIYERTLSTIRSQTFNNSASTEQTMKLNYTHHWFTGGIDIRRIFAGKYLLGIAAYFAQQESGIFGTRGRLGVKAGILP